MPERNIELLEKTIQYIKDHPEKHYQREWVNTCGTAACFCGWAAMLSGYTAAQIKEKEHEVIMTYFGADLLGLNSEEAYMLFKAQNTREMLELMVKDLVNGDELRDWYDYCEEAHGLWPKT